MVVSGLYGLSPHTRYTVDVFSLTSTYSDTSSDAINRRPHGTDIKRWRTHGYFCPASFINTRLSGVYPGMM